MVNWNRYPRSGWASIFCGGFTVILGLVMTAMGWKESVIKSLVIMAMAVNAVLHVTCYLHSLKSRPNGSILTILIVEFFLCIALPLEPRWMAVYGVYLVMNGASLAAIPLRRCRIFGVIAILSGVVTYFQPILLPIFLPQTAGLGLVLNGGERLIMALKSKPEGKYDTK